MRGMSTPPELFGSTTIDCSACMEKANTHGTAEATGVVIEPVSTMAADITDDRALGLRLQHRRSFRRKARPSRTKFSAFAARVARRDRHETTSTSKSMPSWRTNESAPTTRGVWMR